MNSVGAGGNYFANVNAQWSKELARGDSQAGQSARNNSGIAGQQKKDSAPKSKPGAADESGLTLSDGARQHLQTETEHHAEYVAEHGQELAQQSGLQQTEDTNQQDELQRKRGFEREQAGLADSEGGSTNFVEVESTTGELQQISLAEHATLQKMDDPDFTDQQLLDDIPETSLLAANEVMDTQLAQGVSKVATLKSDPKVEALTEVMEIAPAPRLAEPLDILGPGSDKLSAPLSLEFPPEMGRVAAERAAAQLAAGEEQEMFLAGAPGQATSLTAPSPPSPPPVAVPTAPPVDEIVFSPDGSLRQQRLPDGSALTVVNQQGQAVPLQLPPGVERLNLRQPDGSYRSVPVPESAPFPPFMPVPGQVQQPVRPGFLSRLKYLFTGNPAHLQAPARGPAPPWMTPFPSFNAAAEWRHQALLQQQAMASAWAGMNTYFNPMSFPGMFTGPAPSLWPPPFNPAPAYPNPTFFNPPPPVPPALLRNDPVPQQAGAVVVLDSFGPTGTGNSPHGDVVRSCIGGSGPVACRETLDSGSANRIRPNPDQLSPEQIQGELLLDLTERRTNGLRNAASQLQELRAGGLHHSAVNMSYGNGPAFEVATTYDELRPAWSGDPVEARTARMKLGTYAKAFGLDTGRLLSQDPAVFGPERTRLQQALVDLSQRVDRSSDVQAAHRQYGDAVKALAAEKVSVVTAAGNFGNWAERNAADRGGAELQLPNEFYDNMLSTDDTVTVGGTFRHLDSGETRMFHHTNNSYHVSVLASAEANEVGGKPAYGTSYASPRIASALASLHARYPEKSNDECLKLLTSQACDEFKGVGLPHLNESKLQALLAPASATV